MQALTTAHADEMEKLRAEHALALAAIANSNSTLQTAASTTTMPTTNSSNADTAMTSDDASVVSASSEAEEAMTSSAAGREMDRVAGVAAGEQWQEERLELMSTVAELRAQQLRASGTCFQSSATSHFPLSLSLSHNFRNPNTFIRSFSTKAIDSFGLVSFATVCKQMKCITVLNFVYLGVTPMQRRTRSG